ncbi:aspartate--tRNA(Asn) ligase [Candidatus Micrarchaeota archaeon]|nr:aspartate--tRNA(Asn) ligase [Candidatus Micrarchaeota archaeon]
MDRFETVLEKIHDGKKLRDSTSHKQMKIKRVNETQLDKEIVISGWVYSIRDIGELTFITLKDNSGKIQVKLTKKPAQKIEKESAIWLKGRVKKEPRAPGGLEIEASEIKILGKTYEVPPFYSGVKEEPGINVRLDNRALDLRRDKTHAIFKIRATLQGTFREALMALEFIEINPSTIVGSATEGGAQLFKIDYFDKPAFLAQSPQFYKQLAVIGGLERVFITTPVFRAEKHEGPFHINEILQMDIEMAFATDEDAIAILSSVFSYMLNQTKESCADEFKTLGIEFEVPQIKTIRYEDAVTLLGANGEKIKFGEDLSKEHEAKLCELTKTQAVILRDYPTAVRAFYSMPYQDNPKVCKSYDLIYKGMEICSGAQRIHIPELLEKQIAARDMDPKAFRSYIDAFKYGAPPHAGWSIGLDRLTMAVCGLNNIREAVMFPRDKQRVKP